MALPLSFTELHMSTADPKSSLIAKAVCSLAVLRSLQERAKVTASVVDIDADAHTVLFPATVSDRGGGNYEVSDSRGRGSPGGGNAV